MAFYSPLRYPGGKGKLASYIELLIKKNNLSGGTYVEPFAGGAGVALALLFNDSVSRIIINDINTAIYSFWYSVVNHTDDLCRLINDTPVTVEEWQRQKDIQRRIDAPCLELGFSTFFLNRTNRSGIIEGGIIGGLNQVGKWKIDARYNKLDLINRINNIAIRRHQIEVYNLDVFNFIDDVLPNLNNRTFVYFDPPYYKKGGSLYENHFKHNDHRELAEKIINIVETPWVVTYDNVEEIESIYNGCEISKFFLNYSAGKKYQGSELMIFPNANACPSAAEIKKNKIRVKFA